MLYAGRCPALLALAGCPGMSACSHITVNELVLSGYGHTVCSILTDVDGFWAYEGRENQASPESTEVTDAAPEPVHPHDRV